MLIGSVIALWVLVLALTVLVIVLYRQFGLIYIGSRDRIAETGLQVGSTIPLDLRVDIAGQERTLLDPSDPRTTLLLMTAPGCRLCAALLPDLGGLTHFWRDQVRVIVVDREEARGTSPRTLPDTRTWEYAIDVTGDVQRHFDVQAVPIIFLIDPARLVLRKGIVNVVEDIGRLMMSEIEADSSANLDLMSTTPDGQRPLSALVEGDETHGA